jgi:sec-independent protein translocase protein TatA
LAVQGKRGYAESMGSIGTGEIVLLLLLALLLFGAKRLPEIGRSLGSGMKEFKDSVTGVTKHDDTPELAPPTSVETTTTSPREHETV